MKTSKRKRSPKSTPVVDALDSAPAAIEVVAPESANEPVVAEATVAASEPAIVETIEPVVAEASEAQVVEAPVAVHVDPVVVLAANCSVKDAATLKTSLCAVSAESAAVTLDASAVERVDTATMQLLCAFARDRNSRNQSIVWRGKSQALHDAVRLLGVAALLGFEEANGVAA